MKLIKYSKKYKRFFIDEKRKYLYNVIESHKRKLAFINIQVGDGIR